MLSTVELGSCISNDFDILIALLGRYRFQFTLADVVFADTQIDNV